MINDSKVLVASLSLLSTISAHSAFLFAFPIVCHVFMTFLCGETMLLIMMCFVQLSSGPTREICIDFYVKTIGEGSSHTHTNKESWVAS